jgi:hypothetical protein
MKWTLGGPDLPPEILQSLEDGSLVVFCGAGISIPAGLVSFRGLVEKVYQLTNQTMSEIEESEFSRDNFDRVLGLLEHRTAGNLVRKAVMDSLRLAASADLDTHKALLKLATSRDGICRLVTTNFDRAFEIVNENNILIDSAPRLPVPKIGAWSSIVHLHGRISDADPDGKSLVITSADFGAAYLTEQWASRFVSDLFRRFSVMFVGYRVEDPVVRYMMDAFAADRATGEGLGKAFVLSGCAQGAEEIEARRWKAKGVIPLLYENSDNHAALHRTLKRWAECHERGLLGKESVIAKNAAERPAKPMDESAEVSQVLWAIREKSGHVARVFSRMEPLPPIEWLEVFEMHSLLCLPPAPPSDASGNGYSVPLADQGTRATSAPPLNPVSFALGEWLSRHLGKAETFEWIVRTGSVLHPAFRESVRRGLSNTPEVPAALRKLWKVLASETSPSWNEPHWFSYDLLNCLAKGPWDLNLRQDVLGALAPALLLNPSMTRMMHPEGGPFEDSVAYFTEAEVVPRCRGNARQILEAIEKLPTRNQVLAELADDATSLLSRAMQLKELMEQAAPAWDWSYLQQPSISPHPQNSEFYEWTIYVDLCRESWRSLLAEDRGRARSLVERWQTIHYPIFRRLCYFAMTESTLFSAEKRLSYALENEGIWLWSVHASRERYRLILGIWSNLSRSLREDLTARIVSGPPRSNFRAEVTDVEYLKLASYQIWLYLSILEQEGRTLPPAGIAKLAELRTCHPQWTLQEGDRNEFESWMEGGFGEPPIENENEFIASTDDQILDRLSAVALSDKDLRRWRHLLQANLERGIMLLGKLADAGNWHAKVWRAAIEQVGRNEQTLIFWPAIATLLFRAQDHFLAEIVAPLAYFIKAVRKGHSASSVVGPEDLLWKVWDRIQPHAFSNSKEEATDYVTSAINRPAGHLTEALLEHCFASDPKGHADISEDHWRRIRLIGEGEGISYIFGRVLLSAFLARLHVLAPVWVEMKLLPRFDVGSSNEAMAAWQGFLWAPYITEELWPKIKTHFLKSLERLQRVKGTADQSCRVLGMICIDKPDWLSADETRHALRTIEANGRAIVAQVVWRRLEAAGVKSVALWRDQIGPWLAQVWPKDRDTRDPLSSLNLALASTTAGEEFASAVDLIVPLLIPAKDCSQLWIQLEASSLPDREPQATLKLAVAIFDEDSSWIHAKLREVLQRIEKASAAVSKQPAFQKLDERLRRLRL